MDSVEQEVVDSLLRGSKDSFLEQVLVGRDYLMLGGKVTFPLPDKQRQELQLVKEMWKAKQ